MDEVGRYWDARAADFDEEPDHGLRDAVVRGRWRELMVSVLPAVPARVADLGCGTGSIAVLLAEEGYDVHGVDVSAAMVAAARVKAGLAAVAARVERGDVAVPGLEAGSFDVVFARHVLWALPDPEAVVGRWVRLLRPGGRLVLVEGHWYTGGGLSAARCEELVLAHRDEVVVRRLDDPLLWGRVVSDERYMVVSER